MSVAVEHITTTTPTTTNMPVQVKKYFWYHNLLKYNIKSMSTIAVPNFLPDGLFLGSFSDTVLCSEYYKELAIYSIIFMWAVVPLEWARGVSRAPRSTVWEHSLLYNLVYSRAGLPNRWFRTRFVRS